jgi:nucleotide-binding universal stress UspA family protein
MGFKRILCAVDFSETSARVFERAAELAEALNTEVHVLHVIEAASGSTDLDYEQKAMRAMDALVTPFRNSLGKKLTIEITTGRAFDEIVNRVRSERVDLVVMGAKGLTLLEEGFPGRTTEHVVKHAGCSVLVVRNRN